ncbi:MULTISPECIES: ComF family protein [unclassified Rhizobacter]|uniref:ComF family protein n=1 Tax=unclassified Rhizobacter TaxID=2640088 RepID=UPI0006FA3351|nr:MULTISPECIES: phosphoribosyltransferase family protein [unclassified Rhizobacter]KQU75009.1 hypothetical protein ASC88_25665 [Rhizobacter sp. Root29]KQW01183.1 hypothetical protein ASC98_07300 [Rhizobacter sp. Root1238]KRB03993.1 hypothetical protein ASE08_14805 [Rhizobacter sp. Root16D2]
MPSLCAVCQGWETGAAARVCRGCVQRFAVPVPRCNRCALEVPAGVATCGACVLAPPPFDAAFAGTGYAHPWSGLVARFKFNGALDLADALAARLHAARQRDAAPWPQLLLPVPLAVERLRERGFNQAWELARRLAAGGPARADAGLLLRLRATAHQLELPPERRAANVRGAFAVEPLRRGELAGRHVALVDDVMTSGATLAELARVLKQAGVARVEAWVVARTPRPSTAD